MKRRRRHDGGSWRWVVVAALVIGLVSLGQLSLAEAENRPYLGVRAERQAEQMVVTWVQMASLAKDAGIRPGGVVLAIGGRPVAPEDGPAAVAAASSLLVRAPDGTVARVSTEAATPLSDLRRISFIALAIGFVAVGGAVFVLAVDVLPAAILLGVATAAAVGLLGALATPNWTLAYNAIVYLGLVATALGAVLLFLVFPVNRLRTGLGRLLAAVGVGTSLALFTFYAWAALFCPDAHAWVLRLEFVYVVVSLALASGLAISSYRATKVANPETSRALGLVALATAVGVAPFCLLSLLPYLLGAGYLLPPDVAILPVVLIPAGLGVAILGQQLLGIRRLIQRGFLVLVAWLLLLALYAAGLELLRNTVLWSTLLYLAIVAGTFPLTQRLLWKRLENLFFRDVYDYAATLQQLAGEVVVLSGLEDVANHVLHRLGTTLDLCSAAIGLRREGSPPLIYRWGDGAAEIDPLALPTAEASAAALSAAGNRADGFQAVPLVAEGTVIGTLAIGPKRQAVEFTPEDTALLATLAPLVATALRNRLLVLTLEEQVKALREREDTLAALSARLMSVQEEERRQLALDLHDDPLQRAIILARAMGEYADQPQSRRWQSEAEEIITSLRALCADLRPPVLDDFGLIPALERLVNDVRARSDLDVSLTIEPDGQGESQRLEPNLEVALYRVSQEALANCQKHAQATHVEVRLWREDRRVKLQVRDDGRGLVAGGSDQRRAAGGAGIVGMRERLRPWNGQVVVRPGEGGGTVVLAEVSLEDGD